mmetsp:Transcript_17992/g.57506  ORF Transcript_17992/g.57506 Transcript_17992/m.57506 type:complete len:272 (-) Transcript_17992:417-1232(-)
MPRTTPASRSKAALRWVSVASGRTHHRSSRGTTAVVTAASPIAAPWAIAISTRAEAWPTIESGEPFTAVQHSLTSAPTNCCQLADKAAPDSSDCSASSCLLSISVTTPIAAAASSATAASSAFTTRRSSTWPRSPRNGAMAPHPYAGRHTCSVRRLSSLTELTSADVSASLSVNSPITGPAMSGWHLNTWCSALQRSSARMLNGSFDGGRNTMGKYTHVTSKSFSMAWSSRSSDPKVSPRRSSAAPTRRQTSRHRGSFSPSMASVYRSTSS